jgi:hypothetical protein
MDEFSIRFIEALRNAEHRAVRAMAGGAVEAHGGMRCDGVTPAGHPYCVTTESGNEVIVGLGLHWHVHLGEFKVGPDVEEPFASVIQFLVDLVREQVIIVEWYCGRQHLGSSVQRHGEKSPRLNRANRRVNLSWAGTHDGESTLRNPS